MLQPHYSPDLVPGYFFQVVKQNRTCRIVYLKHRSGEENRTK